MALHRFPLVWRECYGLRYNYKDAVSLYTFLTTTPINYLYLFIYNILFNAIDIVYEYIAAYMLFRDDQYLLGGEELGKILTDILVKNGLNPSWRTHNSNVFRARNQTPADDLELRASRSGLS